MSDLYWIIQDKRDLWFVDKINAHTSPKNENAIQFKTYEEAKKVADELGKDKYKVVGVRNMKGIKLI